MEDTIARNEKIRAYRAVGYSLGAIAAVYGVTRQRVNKICGPTGRPAVLRTVLELPLDPQPAAPVSSDSGALVEGDEQ